MSRRRRPRRGASPVTAGARALRPVRVRLPRWLAWAVPALFVAGALLWSPAHRLVTRTATPPTTSPEPEAVARLGAEEALRIGLALGVSGRDPESLPYFRHAIERGRGGTWEVRYNYATALYNTTLRIGTRNGLPTQALRSSWERIALVRQAIEQLALAEGLTRTPQDRAIVRSFHAEMFQLWGMPWDAFAACRQAHSLDPGNGALLARAGQLAGLMRAPDGDGIAAPR